MKKKFFIKRYLIIYIFFGFISNIKTNNFFKNLLSLKSEFFGINIPTFLAAILISKIFIKIKD